MFTKLDPVRARNGRSTAQIHKAPSNENQDSFTLIDVVVIAGLLLATAVYPAMTWLLLYSCRRTRRRRR